MLINVIFKSHGFCLNAPTIAVYASALVVTVTATLGSSILHERDTNIIICINNICDILTEQKN